MSRPQTTRGAVFMVVLGLLALVTTDSTRAGGLSDARAHTWMIESTPNPRAAEINVLSAVSCPSRRTCTAVGSAARTLSSPTRTLVERWNGGRWRIQPSPTPKGTSDTLYGVSCPSARTCVAVGTAFHTVSQRNTPLIEVWNGERWRVQRTPNNPTPSSLAAVSCSARSSCTAVGFTFADRAQAIVERWNGRTWRMQVPPRPARRTLLLGVSCTRARACTAVGYKQGSGNAWPLAESWNGDSWHVRSVPLPEVTSTSPGPRPTRAGVFNAVSCTSPNACTATGTDFIHPRGPTLAERWNGRTWRIQRTPNPANFSVSRSEVTLDAVSCTSARACTAIGAYDPGHAAYFLESWNGSRWRLEPAPQPAGFVHGSLLGLSCTVARCSAVGAYAGGARLQATLAMAG